jgi:arsenate reductase
MAEGWLRHLAGDRFEVSSAGTHPAGLNREAVAAMKESGVDISGQTSKHVEQFAGQSFDYVVTVCDRAKETCPTFHGARSLLHWSFDDPAAAQGHDDARRAVFRRVRDEIAGKIRSFMTEGTGVGNRTPVS